MTRHDIVSRIGSQYLTANIEEDEFSYAKDAGSKAALEAKVGHPVTHYKLDRRFVSNTDAGRIVVLVETKQNFIDSDAEQLKAYLEEEQALYHGEKVIAILANTNNDKIRVWKSAVDDEHLLPDEAVLESMEYYVRLFTTSRQNDRELVMKNTYALNDRLHKLDIDEAKRGQFVGTCLLFVKDQVNKVCNGGYITKDVAKKLREVWSLQDPKQIRSGIGAVLAGLLDGSRNKAKKIELLQRNVLDDQKVRALELVDWLDLLEDILMNIYRYIDSDSSEGQDILNLFFIIFNKYTGRKDKNQAFTPDHITDFMSRVTGIDKDTVTMDGTCGSGSFLVQAMCKALADCRRGRSDAEARALMRDVKEKHIYGIENEEKAYGLATTNMLIHGDGNSNIEFGSLFDKENFIVEAFKTGPRGVILMNPPYNAKPKGIPEKYKTDWGKAKDGKTDPTKGLVFVKFFSDVIKKHNIQNIRLCVLLPMQAAIGTDKIVADMKADLLETNTLEAVFSLPAEIFYPGASAQACCMLFTMNVPHAVSNRKTFFGYYRDDGFKKKKNIGRVEQFDKDGASIWRGIEEEWLQLFADKEVKAGMSAMQKVSGDDEWLCEAYMQTDYSKLTETDFEKVVRDYVAYLVKTGK